MEYSISQHSNNIKLPSVEVIRQFRPANHQMTTAGWLTYYEDLTSYPIHCYIPVCTWYYLARQYCNVTFASCGDISTCKTVHNSIRLSVPKSDMLLFVPKRSGVPELWCVWCGAVNLHLPDSLTQWVYSGMSHRHTRRGVVDTRAGWESYDVHICLVLENGSKNATRTSTLLLVDACWNGSARGCRCVCVGRKLDKCKVGRNLILCEKTSSGQHLTRLDCTQRFALREP